MVSGISGHKICPSIVVMVDWALKINYLSLIIRVDASCCVKFGHDLSSSSVLLYVHKGYKDY